MLLKLKDLKDPSDFEFFQLLLSSADRHPGCYRQSPSWDQALNEDRYMKSFGLLHALHQSAKGRSWDREEWLAAQRHIFRLAFGAGSRNDQQATASLRNEIRERARSHFENSRSWALAMIDHLTPTREIECGKTYYLNGSLIRFEPGCVRVSYDHARRQSFADLQVSFEQAQKLVRSLFSAPEIHDLFLRSEIVAHLIFEGEKAHLEFSTQSVDEIFTEFPMNCPVYAAVDYPTILPIRFAKPLGVSNVEY